MILIKVSLNLLIVGLFLYSKLLPYKNSLDSPYNDVFNFFNSFFTPIFNFLKKFFTPFQVGQGLGVDMTQLVLLIILLILHSLL